MFNEGLGRLLIKPRADLSSRLECREEPRKALEGTCPAAAGRALGKGGGADQRCREQRCGVPGLREAGPTYYRDVRGEGARVGEPDNDQPRPGPLREGSRSMQEAAKEARRKTSRGEESSR